MEGGTAPCYVAFEYLEQNEENPISKCFPSGSATTYIPAKKIQALFKDEHQGMTLEKIFLCPCNRCVQDGGSVDHRSPTYNKYREEELRGDYALIYALLIYIRRPGLIRVFQKHELKLQGTMYLLESNFEVLRKENILNLDLVQKKVLEKQYSFLVRTLQPLSDITAISNKELLPINEDSEPKGEGTFAEVRCFQFQDEEYRSRRFGQHITRFARKIFKYGMQKHAAKEWNNLQLLSKEEGHPHFMVALGAYFHGDKFFILMEEAEQSLHDYLKGPGVEFESKELWKQMKGVADGLAFLHRLYKGTKIAYHQDLKPANILIVKRRLKIADFGLLVFRPVSLPGDTGSTGIPNAHNTGYYAAPRQGRYTRDSDIWSLGCIMSELATCDIQGREGVKDYKESRMADRLSGKDPPRFFSVPEQVVKKSVLERHSSLHICVQSGAPIDRGAESMQFQKKFYTKDFFSLLNSMFKHDYNPTSLLEVPTSEAAVPDADSVAETIERLRKEAAPPPTLDDQIENLSLEQDLLDADMLGPSLEAHLTDFKKILNRRNRTKFAITTLDDLKQYVVNLQAKQLAERRQQGLKRFSPFLERFEQFGELIKRLPSAKELMGFIWGPAKFLLEATDCSAEAFKDVLDIYSQVGRNQPTLSMYKELFVFESNMTEILSATYSDIIQVSKWLVIYFQQRLWTELFATTWKRHKPRFANVIGRMASRLNLFSIQANISQFNFFLNASAIEDEQYIASLERENLHRRQIVHAWLKPTDMENEQHFLENIRAPYPGTCRWLLNDGTFKEWFDPQCTATIAPKMLWLNGKPGSGKTVLASLVVEEARKLELAPTVLFFYFKQEARDRNDFLSMARTLLMQILEQNPYALDYFYSKCCGIGGPLLTSRALVEELLSLALKNCDFSYIVLDGLDECSSRKERGEIVGWFRALIEDLSPDMRDRFRCLFISQNDSARKDYRDLPRITVDAENNEEDIEEFNRVQSEKLVVKLSISETKAKTIADSVTVVAEGIFLLAQLVWINLCGQSSIDSLDREIASMPNDVDTLDKIYARIMRTIMSKPVAAERDEALMLLGWLVCAKRSLKMHEVQTMKSIDLDQRAVDFERRHFRVEAKDLCESLVEIRGDGTIELVHMTARTFLANSDFLDVVVEELRLSTLCIDYLNLPSFRKPYTEEAVLAGEYGFMEYATMYWLRHMEVGLTPPPSGQDDLLEELVESLELLIEQHWNNPTTNIGSIPNRTREILQIFRGSERYFHIQQAVVLTNTELKHFGDLRSDQIALDFASIVSAVRCCIEKVERDNRNPEIAKDLVRKYGTNLFKCPRFSCRYFTEGFLTLDERETHVGRHERPNRCTDEHCRGSKIGFATKAQLERHNRENHPNLEERSHNFPTEEEINESVRENLPEPEPEPEPEPAPEPEVQQAPVVDEPERAPDHEEAAITQPTRLKETFKRRKVKQDYECAHCGKKFAKKFNWQSHLTTHGGGQSFQCPHCTQTCARHTDLVRHMKLHDPDSAVTCGGVLPDGQRWGCGTTFARADILRNHHKSKKGRQCIEKRDRAEQLGS